MTTNTSCNSATATADPGTLTPSRARRWWTPLITLAVFAIAYLALFFGLVLIIAVRAGGVENLEDAMNMILAKTPNWTDPFIVFNSFAMIAIGIPALAFAMRVVERARFGEISSAVGRLRLPFLGKALVVALIVMAPTTIAAFIQHAPTGEVFVKALPALLVALLVAPLQSAAEEYVFRGFALRALLGWGWHILLVFFLPATAFTIGHSYGWRGQVDVATFGLCLTWLALRTRGLEASIALHAVNNTVGALMLILGVSDPTSDPTGAWWSFLVSPIQTIIFTIIVDRLLVRMNPEARPAASIGEAASSAPAGPVGRLAGRFVSALTPHGDAWLKPPHILADRGTR